MDFPRSAHRTIVWPALPSPMAAARLAILQQLEKNQWDAPETIRARQFHQLNRLLDHARATVPFYAGRLPAAGLDGGAAVTPEAWLRMPLLTRGDIQKAGETLLSSALPAAHGQITTASTSGSTGTPVTVHGTAITALFWEKRLLDPTLLDFDKSGLRIESPSPSGPQLEVRFKK